VLVLEPFLHPRSLPVLSLPRTSAARAPFGGNLFAADSAPTSSTNAFGNDPWQEAAAWLGYGAGFRHGLQKGERSPEKEDPAADDGFDTDARATTRAEIIPEIEAFGKVSDAKDGGVMEAPRDADGTLLKVAEVRPVEGQLASEGLKGSGAGTMGADVRPGKMAGAQLVDSPSSESPKERIHNGVPSGKRPREEEDNVPQSVPRDESENARVKGAEATATSYAKDMSAPKGEARLATLTSALKTVREGDLASEAARNVFGLPPRIGADLDSDSDGSLPSIVDGDPDDEDFM
jgi:hypothetical protein